MLLVSETALWPTDQGLRVHGYHMATALRDLGVRVAVACQEPTTESAPPRLRDLLLPWPTCTERQFQRFLRGWRGPGSAARLRLARHQGRDLRKFAGLIPLVERHQPKAVIALGQHGPMMLRGLRDHPDTRTIWYAADEPVFFQLSCMRREPFSHWPGRLRKSALYAAMHALFARGLDGAIGVSPTDTQLLRLIAGVRQAVTIRNGVDLDFFNPDAQPQAATKPHSLVFWGRMDFEPNVDAVCWFAQTVWPRLRRLRPDAAWQIVGKHPHPRVQGLSCVPGIEVLGEVPDVRVHALSAAVTILPVRCGGGIKNKLLEAAAMARPIVASSKAVQGLVLDDARQPGLVCDHPGQWVRAIHRLWSDPSFAAWVGRRARLWVGAYHTWGSAAQTLKHWLEQPTTEPAATTPQNLPTPTEKQAA